MMISAHTAAFLKLPDFWDWACSRLAEEHTLWVPPLGLNYKDEVEARKDLFRRLFKLRGLWVGEEGSSESGAIQVCARFRPMRPLKDLEKFESGHKVKIPLHQRISMIKASRGVSSSEAGRIVMVNTPQSAYLLLRGCCSAGAAKHA